MSPIASLARLRGWTVDERRRELAELYQREAAVAVAIARLDAEIEAEAEAAAALPTLAGNGFAAYVRRMQAKRAELEADAAGLQPRIRAARERLQDAYGDRKAAELVLEELEAQAAALAGRREQSRLDEISLELYRRHPARAVT